MDPSELVVPVEEDESFYDILHTPGVVGAFQDFLLGVQPHFDVELLAHDQGRSFSVRVTPKLWRENADYADNWVIDHGECQRLNDDGTPAGPVGSCNGYFITVDAHGHTVGKLNINIPD